MPFLWRQERMLCLPWLFVDTASCDTDGGVLQFMILVALWIALGSIHDEIYLKKYGCSSHTICNPYYSRTMEKQVMWMYGNRSYFLLFIKTSICHTYAVIWCYRYFLLTVFLGVVSAGLHYELSELVVQFLFRFV